MTITKEYIKKRWRNKSEENVQLRCPCSPCVVAMNCGGIRHQPRSQKQHAGFLMLLQDIKIQLENN